ncbi:hypothetical protein ACXK18_000688 [Campylobacter upsaliensis]
MTKDLRKMILKAYKSLDSLGVSLHKNFYYTLGVYALEFFENEWESYALGSESLYIDKEEKILYEAFFIIVVKSRVFMANIILSKNTDFWNLTKEQQ